ncbi:Translation initiation factor 2, alpha subunit (eIF-2alpha) [Methanocella conradii HZ254]|uniref:Translation initiation factor 2 subunit alpha n=1 Tax=Methanocella conradii (strain DSM 24694 / JCM 17849 / CGMCC 1.5162 / HZ254) TaxID=1041930 RepID=H8I5W3_METCZ|nr:translation initiation factor IF-2 subunit alpha [Methanocella conradii]AFC99780.1 Translation initiation factor 2, alpha subunit (eIF-2alpha) [Methanocella conradii HZ254]MDI6896504.1 translation initiation factor IF-2 subunit alpha [Methanocella conradii]
MTKGWPNPGELVVCTVTKVVDFGAFVQLDEYDNKEGLIHISEVASGWVKYIRDHVREGQKIVCKVLDVNPKRGHIDLSFKDVNEHQRRETIQLWKNDQKASKWLQFVAAEAKIPPESLEEIKDKIRDEYGNLYAAFEDAAQGNMKSINKLGLAPNVVEALVKVAKDNVKIPSVDISGYVDIICPTPNGIDVIKKALKAAGSVEGGDGVTVEITYVGAPRYRIRVVAPDYKKAENILKQAAMQAIEQVKKHGGEGEFHRHMEEAKSFQ